MNDHAWTSCPRVKLSEMQRASTPAQLLMLDLHNGVENIRRIGEEVVVQVLNGPATAARERITELRYCAQHVKCDRLDALCGVLLELCARSDGDLEAAALVRDQMVPEMSETIGALELCMQLVESDMLLARRSAAERPKPLDPFLLVQIMGDRQMAVSLVTQIWPMLFDHVMQLTELFNRMQQRNPIAKEDIELFRIAAHALKGASRLSAAPELTLYAFTMEVAAHNGQLEAIPEQIRKANGALLVLKDAIEAFVRDPDSALRVSWAYYQPT